MRKEFEDAIIAEYPFMRRGMSLEEQEEQGHIDDLYGAYGLLDFGDGWVDLVHSMLDEISECYKKYDKPIDLKPIRAKEKWGSLRFLVVFSNNTTDLTALHKEIREIIHSFRAKSENVCFLCGAEGQLRKDLAYVIPLCDHHYVERINKLKLLEKRTTIHTREDVIDFD